MLHRSRARLLAMAWAAVTATTLQPLAGRAADGDCGPSTTVRKGDTLSSIADRCSVTEATLLDANPTVQGSADLQVGRSLSLDAGSAAARRVDAAVSAFSRKAADAIGSLAGDVGSSVGDLLDKNPDLKARLNKLGERTGLTSGRKAPEATVSPPSGSADSSVTVTASGLPEDQPVAIGAGPPGTAYEVIARVRSTAGGTVSTAVPVPPGAVPGQVIMFSVVPESGTAVHAGRFVVAP